MSTEQIFANLNPESKYFEWQQQEHPFPVSLVPDSDGYHWSGGIGGKYRTTDLDFFTKEGDQFKEMHLCNLGSIQQLTVTKNSIVSFVGDDSHSSYWGKVIEHTNELLKAAKREHKKQLTRELKEREEDFDC
ncbi:MAG: hypothetical protein JKY50_07285 [Oleispira sp.]|nr:hypothetical protein [Oleispira sp.]MBL4881196.1 hypothetical protein [Oleispira sp.]